ncbi:MAG: CxxC-x17-CxxC domain-containing protein [Candidatus Nanoarchaeia archaeon]
MGRFDSDNRFARNRSHSGGSRFGRDRSERRGGFSRDSRRERRPQMHDVTCDKCGRECQVPFKPTGDKPVLCSDCFKKKDSGNNFSQRSSPSQSHQSQGISQEQFSQLNKKLDKIIKILDDLELNIEEDEEYDEDEDEDLEDDEDLEEEDSEESDDEEENDNKEKVVIIEKDDDDEDLEEEDSEESDDEESEEKSEF